MVAENKVRTKILELQEYRRNGCITLDQGAKYDRDKAARVIIWSTKLIIAQFFAQQLSILQLDAVLPIFPSYATSSINCWHS
jgi:hypothetical protein